MALDRLKQMASQVTGQAKPPHPFDPLSESEIEKAVAIIRKEHDGLFFNAVTLWEPRKADMMKWVVDPDHTQRPHRIADVVAIGRGSKVYDGIVDLEEGKILNWELTEGVQPLVSLRFPVGMELRINCFQITMEDLQIVETVVRKDPKVIEQCGLIGIPPEDMHKVYCDRTSATRGLQA